MRKCSCFFALVILFQLLCADNYAQAVDSTDYFAAKKCIDAGNLQWIRGWEQGDASIVAEVFCEDGKMLSGSGAVLQGREAIRKRLQTVMSSLGPDVKVEVRTTKIWMDGDTAYETGEYAYHFKIDGKSETDRGKYFTQWRKLPGGIWKLWLDAGIP